MLVAMMKKAAMLLLAVFAFSSFLKAQQSVTGTVMDNKGAPLPGISVIIKGTGKGTSTNADGVFTLNEVKAGATLVFSGTGYSNQEVKATPGTAMNIILEANIAGLNEIVVVGYGTARKKDITGSVASVKAKDFNQGVIAAPDQLLQGKVPGLEITSNSGQPGAATTIKIRGNNSIRANNNPLYVIDGIPLDGRTARPGLVYSGLDFGVTPESNPLLYINPNDIAQMDVLKDASSAAIYGSRGANGVIVITTKKGTSGKTKIDFGVNMGVTAGYMKKYKVLSAQQFRDFTKKNSLDFDSSSSVDALDAITQHKLTQNYNLAISGGNDNGKFRVSLYASNNEGFIKKTGLDKYLGNFSGQYKFLDDRVSIDFGLIAGHTTENFGLLSNTAGAGGNLMSYALNWNPTKAFYTSSGQYSLASNSVPNPLAVIDGFNDQADVNVFLGNIAAGVKILKNLEYKFLYAINYGVGERNTNLDGWIDGIKGVSGSGAAAISTAKLSSQTFTHTLNYNTQLTQELRFDAVVGYEYWKTNFQNSSTFGSQFNTNLDQSNRIPILYTSIFQNAGVVTPLSKQVDPTTEIQSYFARVNFNLSDKYYLTGTIRADGSSKFGANNKYGYFPSLGVKWLISNEDFLKGNNTISNLGLRASWGVTGNQEFPSGASLEQFTTGSYNNFSQSNVANPDLKWEKTTSFNVGVDYGFLKNRIFGSIDYYHKNTTDLLFQSVAIQPAPASIFFVNLPANLINSGVEFGIGAAIVSNKNFGWDAGFNIAYNKNIIKNFDKRIFTAQVSGPGVSGALAQIIANDFPVNEFYLKKFNGYDANGLQQIDANPSYAGDPNPHVITGFSTSLRYKKFSLSVNASGAFGYLIYNNTANTITNIGIIKGGKNISTEALTSNESVGDGIAASTRYLEKGDYMKLRNATLTYALGDVGKYIKNLNVFVGGTNLFVITKFTGFDPEVNIDKSNNNYPSRSMEYIPYPTPRIITFGVNLGL